jgi:hypothetical protein
MDPKLESTSPLAQRCAEETDKFRRNRKSDPEICFELFRRGLAEQADDALTHIYRIFFVYLYKRIRRHYPTIREEDIQDFFSIGFNRFFNKLQGDNFENFTELGAIINYLNACVFSAIHEEWRRKRPATVLIEDTTNHNPHFPEFDREIRRADIWSRICDVLPDEDDLFLARCLFVDHLKPSEVLQFHPDRFDDTEAIRVARQRIVRTLRKDSDLRDLLD